MNLTQMRFRDFVWRQNPVEITVEQAKNIKESLLPFSGSHMQDLGMAKRKIRGRGFFVGRAGEESAIDEFKRLREVFEETGSGVLQLPSHEPFLAVMDRLDLIGGKGSLVEYTFSFTESASFGRINENREFIACRGESLWDFAGKPDLRIDDIVSLNPHIKNINAIRQGERVVVP